MLNTERLARLADKAAEKLGLSPEEAKLIQSEAHGVYEYVGGDLAPDNKRSMTCRRSTIIEVVLDAGRLEQQLRADDKMTPAMKSAFEYSGPNRYKLLIDLVGPAFPYEAYEVSGESC